MTKKIFNVEKLQEKLNDENVFFRPSGADTKDTQPLLKDAITQSNQDSTLASNHASMLAREPKNKKTSPTQARTGMNKEIEQQDELIQTIRKVVKEVGKETLFLRLTPEEKERLKDIVYSLSKQRKQISENEVGRIALNYLLEDFRTNGKMSILARMIEALNA